MASTTSRLLLLLSLLQSRRDWPGTLLADRLEISDRTVRRDIDRLREMGYSIRATMGPDGGYRLDAGSELPPLLFDDDQVIALAIALQSVGTTGVDIDEAAARALTTIRQVMPSRVRHRLDALRFRTLPKRPGDVTPEAVQPDVLIALSGSIRDSQVLRFDYLGGPEPRRVEPHHLVASQGRWYLITWDLDRDDWRVFRADRITPRVPTGPRFARRVVPGGSSLDFLSSRFRGSTEAGDWPCRGTVILNLPIAEVLPFAGDGVVEAVDADHSRLESGSWSWIALAASLGRFDTEIEVVEPAELVRAFGELAERYAATAKGAAASSGLNRTGGSSR